VWGLNGETFINNHNISIFMGKIFELEDVVRNGPCTHCDDDRYSFYGKQSKIDCDDCGVPMHVKCYEKEENCGRWGCYSNVSSILNNSDNFIAVEQGGLAHKLLKKAHTVTGPIRKAVQKYQSFIMNDDPGSLLACSTIVNLALFPYLAHKSGIGALVGFGVGVELLHSPTGLLGSSPFSLVLLSQPKFFNPYSKQ